MISLSIMFLYSMYSERVTWLRLVSIGLCLCVCLFQKLTVNWRIWDLFAWFIHLTVQEVEILILQLLWRQMTMDALLGPLVCVYCAHLFSFSQLYLILQLLLPCKIDILEIYPGHSFLWVQMWNYSGNSLVVNSSWKNPSGEWHVGCKLIYELFTSTLTDRLKVICWLLVTFH